MIKKIVILFLSLVSFLLGEQKILVVSTSQGKTTQSAKLEFIKRQVKELNLKLDYKFDTEIKAQGELLSQYDLILFDSLTGAKRIRGLVNSFASTISRLDNKVLPLMKENSAYMKNLTNTQRDIICDYWLNGGVENIQNMAKYIKYKVLDNKDIAIKKPNILPINGIYYPNYKGLAFTSTKEYFKFLNIDIKTNKKPIIAIYFGRNSVVGNLTKPIDDTIKLIEKKGAIALAFYYKKPKKDDTIGFEFLQVGSKTIPNAMLYYFSYVRDNTTKKEEFKKLNIPIIHAFYYRGGDQKKWEKDKTGMPLSSIAGTYIMPESLGFTDSMVIGAQNKATKNFETIPYQLESVVNKAFKLTKLQSLENKDKQVALIYYALGKDRVGASFLNVHKSIETIFKGFNEKGYTEKKIDEAYIKEQTLKTIKVLYDVDFYKNANEMLKNGHADLYPYEEYIKEFYKLPVKVRTAMLRKWDYPLKSKMMYYKDKKWYFLIPRVQIDNIVLMPQPLPMERVDSIWEMNMDMQREDERDWHNPTAPISHSYFATYLYLQKQFKANAVVHLGTHGTVEWTYGKQRGLSIYDSPLKTLGDMPHFYTYIVNNTAESVQVKRRARGVIISHQTPPFALSGAYNEINELMELVAQYKSVTKGLMQKQIKEEIIEKAMAINLHKDIKEHQHTHNYQAATPHEHTPHFGVVEPLYKGKEKVAFAELKLPDDKGNLELWFTKDKEGMEPFDLPLNSKIKVTFPSLNNKTVTLEIKNNKKNEDKDGKGNIRKDKTNYFVFPGTTGEYSLFLNVKGFSSDAIISFSTKEDEYKTNSFELVGHKHKGVDGHLHDLEHDHDHGDHSHDNEKKPIKEENKSSNHGHGDYHTKKGELTKEDLDKEFDHFVHELEHFLLGITSIAQPLGNHTFGTSYEKEHLITTIIQMIGKEFLEKANGIDYALKNYKDFNKTKGYKLIQEYVIEKKKLLKEDLEFKEFIEKGKHFHTLLISQKEDINLFRALDGEHVEGGTGGGPIRNPQSLPTGVNLVSFDPTKVPTAAAFKTGKLLMEDFIVNYYKKHKKYPNKLTFNLWGLETVRHHGVLESQLLAAIGVEPIRNAKGKIKGVKVIPYSELKRPRVDVVVSATGLYRDMYPNTIKLIAEAVKKVSELKEENNYVRENSLSLFQALLGKKGIDEKEAKYLSTIRVFSTKTGTYGGGVGEIQTTSRWKDDKRITKNYLEYKGYYFGTDINRWNEKNMDLDLYAKNLSGTDAVVFSRSSNLFGLLSSDDPYTHFGTISMAIRNLDGKAPDTFISNLRDPKNAKIQSTQGFMSEELRGRYFHPQWIEQMKKENYSGTVEISDALNNFWGWQVVNPKVVRSDQWDEFKSVYIDDKYKLDMQKWFKKHNPQALHDMVEKMLEAYRKNYWNTDIKNIEDLVKLQEELEKEYKTTTYNTKLKQFTEMVKLGFGLNSLREGKEPSLTIKGQKLQKQVSQIQQDEDYKYLYILLVMMVIVAAGIFYESRKRV